MINTSFKYSDGDLECQELINKDQANTNTVKDSSEGFCQVSRRCIVVGGAIALVAADLITPVALMALHPPATTLFRVGLGWTVANLLGCCVVYQLNKPTGSPVLGRDYYAMGR